MKLTIRTILILVFFYSSSIVALAIPEVKIDSKNTSLSNFTVALITDSSKKKSIEEIALVSNPEALISSRFHIKSTKVNYWFVFKLKNTLNKKIQRLIRFDEVYMENADIYYRKDKAWHHEENGLSKALEKREIANRAPVFLISLKPGESKIFYLKLHSKFILQVGIVIDSIRSFALSEQKQIIGYFLYFGVALAMFFYNMFLLITLRERVYFYYISYIANFILFVFLYSGYSLYFNSSVQLHYTLHISITLVGAFLTLFTRNLLNTRQYLPHLDKALLVNFTIFLIIGLLVLIDIQNYFLLETFGMVSMLFLFGLGFYSIYKKVPLAVFYTVALSAYLIGLSVIAALNLGLLPYNFFTRYSFLMGSFAELLLFSLTLGYRVRLLQNEKILYQEKLLNTEKSMKEELEKQVVARTKDLSKSEKRFRILAGSAFEGVVISFNDIIIDVNQSLLKMFGYTMKDLIGKNISDFITFKDRNFPIQNELNLALEAIGQKKDSSIVPIEFLSKNFPYKDKLHTITAVRDITERKRKESLQKDVEQMINHDLKNPLNAIIGFSELLLMEDFNHEVKDFLTRINKNGERILYMLDHSLDFFKMEEGTYLPQPVDFNFIPVLKKLVLEFKSYQKTKHIKLVCRNNGNNIDLSHSENSEYIIYGEQVNLTTLFSNLLKNALEASPENSEITFELSDNDKQSIISIHNKGVIPTSIQVDFFGKYISRGKKKGTGIGTYSAKLIASIHGGNITFSSTEQDGTKLTVKLPKK